MDDILSKIIVRPIELTDSLEELTKLLHKAYKKLEDQGFRFFATHQDVNTTKRRIEQSECFVAILHDKIIGTISYQAPNKKSKHEYYDQPFVASFGQFAVDPQYQNQGIGGRLMDIVDTCALRDNAKEIGIDTAEGATHLIEYYKKRNYFIVGFVQWDITNYRSVILAKKLNPLISSNPTLRDSGNEDK